MKPTPIILVSLLIQYFAATGQLATIRDPDGFTNIRAHDSAKARIIGRFHVGEIFSYDSTQKQEWILDTLPATPKQ